MAKKFYRSIEQLLRQIDASQGTEEMLRTIVRRLVEAYAEPYGIASGRLYRERAADYVLIESIGEFGASIAGKTVPRSYPIVRQIEKERLVQVSSRSHGFDPDLESQFTHLENAAVLVGDNPAYIISLGIRRPESREELLVMLETIRTAVGLKLRQNILEDQLRQARGIQMSLLPRRLPNLKGFELAAVTRPAEEVGGDVYDVLRLGGDALGIMVADSSGHGLPAALQARDVVIGLRMATARDQKITAMIHRLNRVIHRSSLASRFISLFYCEIEQCGDVFYVNAGHCPPLLLGADGEVRELASTGPVLGPLPDVRFRRGYAELEPGCTLVVFSDGVTERKEGDGDGVGERREFGRDRLLELCRRHQGRSARFLAGAILKAVRDFGGGAPWQDDVTVLVVRRQAPSSPRGRGGDEDGPGADSGAGPGPAAGGSPTRRRR